MGTIIKWIQKFFPRIGVKGYRGWCLKYVDDAGNATKRRPSAKAAFLAEKKAGRISLSTPPKNIWVVGYLDLTRGGFAAYDHVFLMKYKGNGKYEIRDSETASGVRSVYTSIDSVLAWFSLYAPKYIGWSYITDGRQYAEKKTIKVLSSKPLSLKKKSGTATVAVSVLNVRERPSTSSKIVATYKKGQKFKFDSYITLNGYTWLSYVGWSGKRRYVAQGKGKTKYVKGGL